MIKILTFCFLFFLSLNITFAGCFSSDIYYEVLDKNIDNCLELYRYDEDGFCLPEPDYLFIKNKCPNKIVNFQNKNINFGDSFKISLIEKVGEKENINIFLDGKESYINYLVKCNVNSEYCKNEEKSELIFTIIYISFFIFLIIYRIVQLFLNKKKIFKAN